MIRRISILALGVIAAAILLSVSASAQDPVKVAPNMYRVLMENDRVRILEAKAKPGEKIGVHSHPDHAVYVVSGDKLAITDADGKTSDNAIKAGDTMWIPAAAHSAVNSGKTELRVVVIELKEPAKKM